MLERPGLYIHYPWCVKKCPYCDFNSHPIKGGVDQEAYRLALEADWAAQSQTSDVFASVFFGGGTPSLFHPKHIGGLLDKLPIAADAEITLEVNPGTQEYMEFSEYRSAGINRLSVGAQSFDEHKLKRLGRIHQSTDTTTAFIEARNAGFKNINLDLMWGLPEQTVADALSDLQIAIDLQPEHISWYQLTIEAKTEFAKRTPILPMEQEIYDMEQAGLALLTEAGFHRYEVSAFAKSDQLCKHNLNYWQFGDYVGLGAGAHGKHSTRQDQKLIAFRSSKPSQPRLYMANPKITEQQQVAADDLILEFMMNALRLTDGVDWPIFEQRTGLTQASIMPVWENLVMRDLVRADRCAPTIKGTRYLDSVLQQFV